METTSHTSFWGTVKSVSKGVLWLGLASAVIGIVLQEFLHEIYPYAWLKLFGVFITEVGFACIIAFGVAVTIEAYAQREHAKGIIGYLYAIDLDSSFFDLVEKYVVKCPFYRKEVCVSYTFIRDKGESFLLECKVSYRIVNVSRMAQEFCASGSLEISPLNTKPHQWPERLGFASMIINGRMLPKEAVRLSPGSDSERCEDYKALEGIRLKPQESVEVEIRHYVEKLRHDSEVWQAAVPSSGVELRLGGLSKYNLAVGTEAIHPEGQDMEKLPSNGGLVLKLKEPLMVRNGIHFWWSPKAPKDADGPAKRTGATVAQEA